MDNDLFKDLDLDFLGEPMKIEDSTPSSDVDTDSEAGKPSKEIEIEEQEKEIENTNDSDDTDDSKETDENADSDEDSEDHKRDTDAPTPESSSHYLAFASALREKGLINADVNEDLFKNAEDPSDVIFDLIQDEISNGIEQYKSTLDETQKSLADAVDKGIPVDKFTSIKNEINKLNEIDDNALETNEELRKQILIDEFKTRGYKEERAIKMTERLIDLGDDIEEAKQSLEVLREIKQNELTNIEAEAEAEKVKFKKQQEKLLEEVRTKIDTSQELIPGVKLNDKIRNDLYDSLTKPSAKDENGNPISAVVAKRNEDPLKFEMYLHYFNIMGFFDGKFDGVLKSSKTKAIKEFDELLKNNTSFGTKSTRNSNLSKNDLDLLNDLKKVVG